MSTENQGTQQIQLEVPFDEISLPSKGLLYPNQKSTVKVEYLTAADENILTSQNLIKNGKVLEVLLQRKIKDKDLPHSQLLVGDRNAIMIWLRATGYGEMYPIKLTDPETYEEFETEVDLSKLKSKELTAQPDENGLFDFELPRSKKKIKFKLLTVGDETSIIKSSESREKAMKNGISNMLTYRLATQIKEIDGNSDPNFIQRFIQVMPALDSLKFREYSDSIEPGIDMEIELESPSGFPFKAQVPIGLNFFWPNAGV
jgi:hypothetical protein